MELDGAHHRMPRQRRSDERRDADLRAYGITVVRLPADLVVVAPERFVAAAREAIEEQVRVLGKVERPFTLTPWG